jgi:hypothetical protein
VAQIPKCRDIELLSARTADSSTSLTDFDRQPVSTLAIE